MNFIERLQLIERIDQLIRLKATGSSEDLAQRLGVSRRYVYIIIDLMRSMDAPILYDTHRKTYYYEYDCELFLGFVDKNKIKGG